MSETDQRTVSGESTGRSRLAERALSWPKEDIEDIVPEAPDPKPAPAAAPVAAAPMPPVPPPTPIRPATAAAPARPVAVETRRPSQVYGHLVEGEDDVIGLVAYALYKQDKREFLANWERQRGAMPTGEQLEAFSTTQMSAGQRDRYRTAARQVLDAYAGVAVDSERGNIVERAVTARIEAAARRAERAGSFWRIVGATLIGFILLAVSAVAVFYGLDAAGVDVASYLPGTTAPAAAANVAP